jgi:hypothetical protein
MRITHKSLAVLARKPVMSAMVRRDFTGPSELRAIKAAVPAGTLRRALAAAIAAIMDSCQRRAERDMARLLGRTGGLLTDAVERSATRRCGDWR